MLDKYIHTILVYLIRKSVCCCESVWIPWKTYGNGTNDNEILIMLWKDPVELSAQFGTVNGLRQGDVLASLLFNVALEELYGIQEFRQEGPTFINRYNFWHMPKIWT